MRNNPSFAVRRPFVTGLARVGAASAFLCCLLALLPCLAPAQTVSSASQKTYPNIFFDNFPGSSLSGNWAGAITATSMGTVTVTGNSALFPAGNRNTKVWTLSSGGPTAIRAKRVRCKYKFNANTGYAGPWICINSNGTTGTGIHAFITGATSYSLRRVTSIESSPSESVIGTDAGIATGLLTASSTTYVWLEVDAIPSGATTVYIERVYAADGTTLLDSNTYAAQSNANTDTAAYPAGFSCEQATTVYAFEVYALDAPQLYTTGTGSYPITTGSTKSLTAAFGVGVAATGPNTYQWQESTNSGSSWSNVSTGSGGTSLTWSSPTLTGGMNGYQYRCIATDSVTGKTNTSGVHTLTTTANPTLASAVVGSGGYTVTLTWSSSLTYASPVPGDFTLTANGSPVLISSVSHTGATTTLTLGTPVFSTDPNVQLSFTGTATDGSSNAVAAITGQVISNTSTLVRPNFAADIVAGYTDVCVRAGKGYIDVPVNVTRVGGNTDSLSLSVSGLPSGASYSVTTQPGTGSTGLVRFTCSSGVSGIGTQSNVVLNVTNGSQTNNSAFQFTPITNSLPANAWTFFCRGNSIINSMSTATPTSLGTGVSGLFGGTGAWTFTSNITGIVGSSAAHWSVAYNGLPSVTGFLHSAINAGFRNNARVAVWMPPYTNDTGSSQSTIMGYLSGTLNYLATNFDSVVVWPVPARPSSSITSSTVASYSAGPPTTITLASGATNAVVNNWVGVANGSGTNVAIRQITAVSGSTMTLSRPLTFTPSVGTTAYIYADTNSLLMRNCNAAVKNYCTNVAGATTPISNVYWYAGTNASGLDMETIPQDDMTTDGVHPGNTGYYNMNLAFRDYILTPHLLKDAVISLPSAPIVLANGTKTITATISGFAAYGGTSAWPGALIPGSWSLVSGPGSINSSTGLFTPSGTAPTTISYTLSNSTALSGQGKIVPHITRRGSGRVGSRN